MMITKVRQLEPHRSGALPRLTGSGVDPSSPDS
jgi:hypothetical protein